VPEVAQVPAICEQLASSSSPGAVVVVFVVQATRARKIKVRIGDLCWTARP
jgi:hypothetical protein